MSLGPVAYPPCDFLECALRLGASVSLEVGEVEEEGGDGCGFDGSVG